MIRVDTANRPLIYSFRPFSASTRGKNVERDNGSDVSSLVLKASAALCCKSAAGREVSNREGEVLQESEQIVV